MLKEERQHLRIEDAKSFRGLQWYRHAERAWAYRDAIPPISLIQLPTDLYPDYPWILADGWGRVNWASYNSWCIPARFYKVTGEPTEKRSHL